METSSKKRLSTSTSIDEFDGELEGFTELESQAPLSTAGNGPYVNGSVSILDYF
jgi:hypothetical protein